MTAAQNVDVNVVHGLRTVLAIIDNDAITLLEFLLVRHFTGDGQQVAEQLGIVVSGLESNVLSFCPIKNILHSRDT